MADKKWSEFDLLKSIKDKNIELLTVVEDDTSITKYDNKRVKLSDILDPINLDITNIKLQIQNILVEGFDLTTIGVDPPYWYNNEDDPNDTQLVELSIAKDLKERLDSTVTRVETLETEIVDVKTNIEEITGDVLINKTNIGVLGYLVDIIKNNYYNKNDILNEVLPDIDDKVPSSEAVFNFVDLTKNTIEYNINNEVLQINNTIEDKSLENKNYTDIEIQKILNKITNLEFDSFYFDNNAKDGEFCVDYDIESVVINKSTQKIFVVEDNKLYKELSLNRPEVLEIANEVVDLHRDNINKSFKNGVYNLKGEDQHITYNGKYVGKTNTPDLTFVGILPEGDNSHAQFSVIKADDSYLFFNKINGIESDFYALIRPGIDKVTYYEDELMYKSDFIDCIKSEYKTFFNKPFVVKCFVGLDSIKFDMRYNSYFSNSVKLNNFSNFFNFIPLAIFCKRCDDFYQTNSSEVFNDYKQKVPHEIDYFHSVHNLNNKFITPSEKQITIQISSFLNGTDTYAVICDSQDELNLLDYLGYSLYIPLNSKVTCKDPSIVKFEDCFNSPPKGSYYLILKGCTNLDKYEFKPIITLSKYNVDGIYESFINKYTGTTGDDVLYGDGTDLKLDLLPITIENITICSNFTEDDCYLNTKPSFITGKDNLCSRGNQFILGCENIPTDSVFIIGHPSNKVLDANTNNYENFGSSRDNIFEINLDGLIFIKSPKHLQKTYDNYNEEVLDLEYRCLQKILIDLNSKILELSEKNSELETELSLLKNRVEVLEEP